MKSYVLQAVLSDQTVVNLDFLEDLEPSLIGIDQYTNAYDFWRFLRLVEQKSEFLARNRVDNFQIAIKGKEYAYSVCFENKYLEKVLGNIVWDPQKRKALVSIDCDAFIEMKDFLFADLNQNGEQFSKHYPYQNRLNKLAHRYIQSYPDCEEDWARKKELEREIAQEIREYRTYRSLCLYRKKLERLKERWRTIPTQSPIASPKQNALEKTIILEENTARYASVWENSSGEEREEFLESEEIKQMVKSYGEN